MGLLLWLVALLVGCALIGGLVRWRRYRREDAKSRRDMQKSARGGWRGEM